MKVLCEFHEGDDDIFLRYNVDNGVLVCDDDECSNFEVYEYDNVDDFYEPTI